METVSAALGVNGPAMASSSNSNASSPQPSELTNTADAGLLQSASGPLPNPSLSTVRKTERECQCMAEQFMQLCTTGGISEEVRLALRYPTFDNWPWNDAHLLLMLRQMFLDLDLLQPLLFKSSDLPILEKWLLAIYRRYNHVPFHNFKHCFMVTQMMYALIWLAELPQVLDPNDLVVLLVASICHDLDHPGYNNAYQINARTSLALRYNDLSPLENHHCAQAFDILLCSECNIFRNVTSTVFSNMREGIIRCILATDMAKHNDILNNFKEMLPVFDLKNKDHKIMLMMILIKTADISNEARPMQCAEPWLACLLEEFFHQSDTEKEQGLPVAPFMDREKVTKASSQCGFIKFVILPLFEALATLYPALEGPLVQPVKQQLEVYAEQERLTRANADNHGTGNATKMAKPSASPSNSTNSSKIC